MGGQRRRTLVAIFLFWFSVYTYPSFLSGYVQNVLGAGSVLVGMIVGSYGFVQMLLRIPLGICSDRVKKRRVFVQAGFLATVLSGAGLSLVALAAARGGISPVPVLFLRGLSGGGAAAWVAFSVLAADQAPPDKTGEAMSRTWPRWRPCPWAPGS